MILVAVLFEEHRHSLIEPAWQAELEMSAAELMPPFMAQGGKGSSLSDVVRNTCPVVTISTGLNPAERPCLLAGERIREHLPLLPVGKKIYFKLCHSLNRGRQLTVVTVICRFYESGKLDEYIRLK